MKRRMTEYLEIENSSGKPMVQCTKCRYLFCSITENYKNHAIISESALSKGGPQYSPSEKFIFREFYCPGCGTRLEVEMCLKNSPLIWDVSLKIKGD
jgi:acetone carboxylase gamma subunit